MLKKKMSMMLSGILIAGTLMACGNVGDEDTVDVTEDKGMDTIGQTVEFDPNKLVNDGEPITVDYWTWNEGDPAITLAEQYEKIYPNVKINVVNNPWDDYWTKLPLSLQGEDGPALFNIHNSQHELLFPYLAAYDISTEDLADDFLAIDTHVIDGEVYYIDSVINTGNMYYNKDLWEESGLTESDIPQTWNQFKEVSKKLTKYDGDKITQAGFNWNDEVYSAIYQGLNYQKGELLFKEDGETVNYDNDITKENLQFLIDLYEVDKVGSKDFGVDSSQSFGNGQSAIVYKWGYYITELNDNYPDINFGVFATPTPDEGIPFAYDRYNGESTPGINKNQTEGQQEVAQDFIRFIIANDDYSKEASLAYASFPNKKSLADDEEILDHPVLKAIAPRVDRLIWPGPFPSTVETTGTETMEDVLYNNVDMDEAVKTGQEKMEQDMSGSDFSSLETEYEFIEEANK